MSLKHVYEKIQKIKNTAASTEKINLLSDYLEDPEFYKVIQLMYSEDYFYNINALPKFKDNQSKSSNSDLFEYLIRLSKQKGASNEDKEKLGSMASDIETYNVLKMIINKDAKAGFSGKSINKAKPGTIYLIPYCRCSSPDKIKNINFGVGAIVQEKANGMFVNILLESEDSISFVSRNGRKIHQMDHLISLFKKNVHKSTFGNVLMGELLVKTKDGKDIEDRKTGNGILNSCIQGTADPEDAKRISIYLWDSVPINLWRKGSCIIPYIQRYNFTKNVVRKELKFDLVKMIETKLVFNLEEANDFFQSMLSQGKEGAVLKNKTMEWKNHTSPEAVKMKKVNEADLRVVGWAFGKTGTKYEKCVGAIICESEDKKVKVSVSGFTDDLRKADWNKYINKIVAVEFESVIKDKNKDTYSLYLPRFVEIRFDKQEADTYETLIAM